MVGPVEGRPSVGEARLEETSSGLAPATDGWFAVNVRDAAWFTWEPLPARCVFESPDRRFPELGIGLRVLRPGQPSGFYHAESAQEDFLVLAGECLLLIEGEERRLRAWDFVHCPPGTPHIFVGAGEEPCVLLLAGARTPGRTIVYPVSEVALRHGAGVEQETSKPAEAYARFGKSRPGRPPDWDRLPWSEDR